MKISIIVMSLILFLAVKLYAYDDGDFQIWNTEVEEFQLKKDLKLALEQEFRWANNASEFYYQHYDAGLTYTLNKSWHIGAGYRQIYSRTASAPWLAESDPYLFFTYFGELLGFKFDNRFRFHYQYFSYKNDSGVYRNKLAIKPSWKLTKFEIQPYVSDETFIMIGNAQGFNQNRLSGGISFTPFKNIKAEVYYMLLSSKSGSRWKDYNVLGTKFKVIF
ncbi:MAG: DUF2490 domain-containing protein [Candidatus Omnitrophica bacterium]|nr:DUF2490 domain-containing protein [Candidatus Omnitrophota bacterium]MBU4303984.1 DUF2490 domain-containing protein [Candidatus Omnitrophota bacterium]MBU4419347.1 DUF2490 domain-containing protein [Candidatus Omnitrophota bacterium]MBU4467869.1 DUF2490 domain-containing protein [Candidatus Omnitrophota bacterium]MCG2707088.1 DUF2490 domain-containing protein [Candidatus Omnitrophota bacterium]